ncbi:hypothetical protein L1049_027930 [Liquidambar formosana]|uniref:Disease resistance protein At4g27190-like leucine-rich repeats domain-containing protein n=1 Tax=Liquidambar formosana TaxID=63359 RepID=A0AAP0WW54_LIQFO
MIDDCASLVEVFEVEGLNVEERDAVLLPMLEDLSLWFLPKLERLLNEKLLFPTCLFRNLKSLDVWSCGNLRNLFSPSMARALVHLKTLEIQNCKMMEEIVVKGENEEADRMNKIVIPQLNRLYLDSLQSLTSFCQSPYAFDLPLLEYVRVYNCPKMKAFSMGNLSTPKLREVMGVWMGDLNNTIQELFKRERKRLEVDQEIGQEEHLVKELEVNQEIEQEEHLVKESEVNQEEHLVKELEVNQEVGQEEHLDNNDDDHEN